MAIFSVGGDHVSEGKSDALVKWMTSPCTVTASDVLKGTLVVLFGLCVAIFMISQAIAERPTAAPAGAQNVELMESAPIPTEEPAEIVRIDQTTALAQGIDAVISSECGDMVTDATLIMVGNAIMNRVEDSRYPDTVDQVLMQPMQFSCFAESGMKWVGRGAADAAWQRRCMDAAERVLDGERLLSYSVVYVSAAKQGAVEAQLDGLYFCK